MINTFSKFFYGWEITSTNRYLDFRYATDVADRKATLRPGKYSSGTLMIEVTRALREAGISPFQMTFNRVTRQFTLTSGNVFSILSNSGASVSLGGGWGAVGFSGASDKSGSTSYTAENSTGLCWSPQFKLQGLTSPGNNRTLRDPIVAETASGIVELSHFGLVQMINFEARFITNITQPNQLYIRNNSNGVSDAVSFLNWATLKGLVEFMPDENNPIIFYPLILESTEADSKGTAFNLIETYDDGLPNYYRTGKLGWRIYDI